jgi:hypothetical protein
MIGTIRGTVADRTALNAKPSQYSGDIYYVAPVQNDDQHWQITTGYNWLGVISVTTYDIL